MLVLILVVSCVVFAVNTAAWLYAFRSIHCDPTWLGITTRNRRIASWVFVPLVFLFIPLMATWNLLSLDLLEGLGFLVFGVLAAIGSRIELRLRESVGDEIVCARCGYIRPDEADEHNLICPECSGNWWGTMHEHPTLFTRTGAMTRLAYVRRKQVRRVLPALGLLPLALVLSQVWGAESFIKLVPTPQVVWLSRSGGFMLGNVAIEELLVHRTVPQATLDSALDEITDERNKRAGLPFDVGRALDQAITAGRFSQTALDRFYGESLEWTLEVEVDPDGGVLIPKVGCVELSNTIDHTPDVVSPGFRINNGSWQQPVDGLVLPRWFAYSYESYVLPGMYGLMDEEHSTPAGAPYYVGFEPIPIGDLVPGTHTITTRIHMYVLPHGSSPRGHTFFGLGGAITPHPQAIWHETRDLTATFVVPDTRPMDRLKE